MAPFASVTSTDFTYTGQRDLPGTGLMDYNARFYSPTLGRFTQPDTIIPDAANSQSWNRYSYVNNNPVRYNDPTGHSRVENEGGGGGGPTPPIPPVDPPSGGGLGGVDGGRGGCSGVLCVPEPPITTETTSGTTNTNYWPDYWILSGIFPICPYGVCGPAVSITVDRYWNVYIAGGAGAGVVPTWGIGGGWFLAPNNDNEEFAESYLKGHNFTVSGGYIGGIAVNNNYPSYIQTHNEGSQKENIAIEALIMSPGVDGSGTFAILLYDNGDDTPWIWQDD